MNKLSVVLATCQSDLICCRPSITFLFVNGFYHANIPFSREFTAVKYIIKYFF